MNAVLHRPTTNAEAIAMLSVEDVRPLAGGASLVAMMNARLVTPAALVSLRHLTDLRGIAADAQGLRIGAMTRHRDTAAAAALTGTLAVLRSAAGQIANPVVRNMGTMGGSISLADPGADYPPALVACKAVIEIVSPKGTRHVPARDFFVDWYTTALAPGELVTAILLPAPRDGIGLYYKLARIAGDFATISVALSLGADDEASIAIGGCGPTPIASDEANAALSGGATPQAIAHAGAILADRADPIDDVRASAEYRRLMIPRMVARAIAEAQGTKAAA